MAWSKAPRLAHPIQLQAIHVITFDTLLDVGKKMGAHFGMLIIESTVSSPFIIAPRHAPVLQVLLPEAVMHAVARFINLVQIIHADADPAAHPMLAAAPEPTF